MRLRVLLPRTCEARVLIDEEKGEVVIEPYFRRPEEQVRVLNFQVESDQRGRESRLASGYINGKTGEFRLVKSRFVHCVFDGGAPTPSTKKPPAGDADVAPAS